jgi:hypothetical protein
MKTRVRYTIVVEVEGEMDEDFDVEVTAVVKSIKADVHYTKTIKKEQP